MQIEPARMQVAADRACGLLKTLGHPDRLMVMAQLADGEKSVGEIADLISISQPALSQHLARLRNEGLVSTRRDAQTIYYSLVSDDAERVMQLLYEIYGRSTRRQPRIRK